MHPDQLCIFRSLLRVDRVPGLPIKIPAPVDWGLDDACRPVMAHLFVPPARTYSSCLYRDKWLLMRADPHALADRQGS